MKFKKNSGQAIISFSVTLSVLEIIASIVCGIYVMTIDKALIFMGIFIMVLGIVTALAFVVLLTAFGELVDSNCRMAQMMELLVKEHVSDFAMDDAAVVEKEDDSKQISIKLLEQWHSKGRITDREFETLSKKYKQ